MFARALSVARTRIVGLCSRHRLALLSAFALGILVIAPQLVFMHSPVYRGVEMIGSDAEEYYVARTKEVYDGYPALGGVFLSQKNLPYLVPGLGENIVARLGQLFAQSAVDVNVSAKFFSPLLIALLVYALIYTLSASVPGALLAGALVVAGDAVLGGPAVLVRVLTGHAPITSFLLSSRPINPEVSALFLFGALLIFVHIFYKNRKFTWLSRTALGLLAGGALYISPFVSSFLFVVYGLSLLWFAFRQDYACVKALAVSIAVGLAAVVPFLLNLIQLRQSLFYVETSLRQGLIHTHMPIVGFWLIALVVSLFIWPRRFSGARPFFAIAVVALIILLNQQIFTGIAIQPAHYHWYLTKPFAGMVLALFAVFLIEWLFKSKLLRVTAYSSCFLILLVSAALVQRDSYNEHYAATLDAQAYAPVFSFLETLPAGQSVWANQTLSLYIPMYTKQDAPNHDFAQYDLASQDFLERRLLLEYALRNVAFTDALRAMQDEREDIAYRLFGVHWRDQYGSYSAIPDSLLERYAHDYTTAARQNIPDQLRSLGVSVMVWDTESDPAWNVGRALGTTPIFRTARFEVYQLATTTGAIPS
jgi:hypothetical protein